MSDHPGTLADDSRLPDRVDGLIDDDTFRDGDTVPGSRSSAAAVSAAEHTPVHLGASVWLLPALVGSGQSLGSMVQTSTYSAHNVALLHRVLVLLTSRQ